MHFSTETDCFAHLRCLCCFFAMDGQRSLRWILVLAILTVPMAFFAYQIAVGDALISISYYVISLVFNVITLLKMTLIRLSFDKTRALMDYFNEHVFHRDDPWCHRLRRRTYFTTWKIFAAMLTYVLLTALFYLSTTRPSSHYIGLDRTEVTWIHVLLVQIVAGCTLLHLVIYSVGILLISFLMHWFQTELEIMANAFEKVFHGECPRKVLGKNVLRRARLQREEVRWTGIERRLVYCISRHGEFVELNQLLRGIAQPIFFSLGFYIVTTISTLIFVTIIDGIFNLLAIVHVAAVIAEFYYYAHLVDELEDKRHMIARAIYEQNWPEQMIYSDRVAKHYKSVRTMIVTVIMFAQRPFRISCGGMYKMTVPVFTTMIETIYFAVTFLIRTVKVQR
ncbi:hypothetical protein pipiens_017167 [Culex pipiens pipiens]|uniref:Odorant receptor n=1 Tax=Culex pipiens pipiens TaxID=38569 RepID=A0ABD1CHT9_CULPP